MWPGTLGFGDQRRSPNPKVQDDSPCIPRPGHFQFAATPFGRDKLCVPSDPPPRCRGENRSNWKCRGRGVLSQNASSSLPCICQNSFGPAGAKGPAPEPETIAETTVHNHFSRGPQHHRDCTASEPRTGQMLSAAFPLLPLVHPCVMDAQGRLPSPPLPLHLLMQPSRWMNGSGRDAGSDRLRVYTLAVTRQWERRKAPAQRRDQLEIPRLSATV